MSQTPLEKKLMEDGFIDEYGIILKGNFKNLYTLTEIVRSGPEGEATILTIEPSFLPLNKPLHFEIVLSKREMHEIMHVKNIIQIYVDKAAISHVVNSLLRELSARASDTLEKIYVEEDAKTLGKLSSGTLRNIDRTSFADHYMWTDGCKDFPKEAYDVIKAMPVDFWRDPMVKSQFKQSFFGALDVLVDHRADTPEAIVVYRAYGNEVGNTCLGKIGETAKISAIELGGKEMLDFDTKMHDKQNKSEGLPPVGGSGK